MSYQIFTTEAARKIASMLLEIEAIKFNTKKPFTWASGWKSPIYCDNRLTLSYPEIRSYIKHNFVEVVKEYYSVANCIAGVATAGIPQGALIADALDLPYIYIRSKPKGHGMENLIEGKADEKFKVILVEDLISTGGSSLAAANAVREAGMEVVGMVAIFTYGFNKAEEHFEKAKIPLVCLSNYSTLLQEALEKDYIKEDQLVLLKSWRVDPERWKPSK
ncbi:MAG: orotate phosphoribosyltransferase [Candidatus Cyclobacteriaceae bacterium M3_2C_046]